MITRRSAIGGLTAAMAALSFPAKGAIPAPPLVKPPRLKAGDTVGLVAPAGFIADRFGLEDMLATVRAMGLVPKPAAHLLERKGYLAGDDRARADDVNAMFADASVRAILSVRGGWGSARILPFLDFATIRANPKLLTGSSDITALHMALAARGNCPTIHGPNVAATWPASALDSFRAIAFDAATPTYSNPVASEDRLVQRNWRTRTLRPGKASGRLLGGNLSVLSAMVGTPWLPDFTGAILFLEDTNEAEYRIDRMLTQLGQGGLLGKLAGVVFGQCTNCSNPDPFYGNFTLLEVLDHHLGALGVPAFQGALVGHIPNQVSMPVGVRAEIDADAGTIRMLEATVS